MIWFVWIGCFVFMATHGFVVSAAVVAVALFGVLWAAFCQGMHDLSRYKK
jgi:hypothetical protein